MKKLLYFTSVTFLLAISAIGQQIYVATSGTENIGVYDAATGSAINSDLIIGLSLPQFITISSGNIYVANYNNNSVSVYTTAGTTVNAPLITDLTYPVGIAVSGNDLFVSSTTGNLIGKFDAMSGTIFNASFISGLNNPVGIALSGTSLYVANRGNGTVGEYDVTTGLAINGALITGLDHPYAITVSGTSLYVANNPPIGSISFGLIGVYDAVTGATINASLVPMSLETNGLSVLFGRLYASHGNLGTVSVYDASTGEVINDSLISGFGGRVTGIAVIPESGSYGLILGIAGLLGTITRKRYSNRVCP